MSSLLKAILDVAHVALWGVAAIVSVVIVGVLLLSIRPELAESHISVGDLHFEGARLGPVLAATLAAIDVYFAGALVIVSRLRRISQTLVAGDPFHPANVRRLQVIAAALAALELARYVVKPLLYAVTHSGHRLHVGGDVSLTTWFGVLVIVVLAEVFREGARLRGEAELTI